MSWCILYSFARHKLYKGSKDKGYTEEEMSCYHACPDIFAWFRGHMWWALFENLISFSQPPQELGASCRDLGCQGWGESKSVSSGCWGSKEFPWDLFSHSKVMCLWLKSVGRSLEIMNQSLPPLSLLYLMSSPSFSPCSLPHLFLSLSIVISLLNDIKIPMFLSHKPICLLFLLYSLVPLCVTSMVASICS